MEREGKGKIQRRGGGDRGIKGTRTRRGDAGGIEEVETGARGGWEGKREEKSGVVGRGVHGSKRGSKKGAEKME